MRNYILTYARTNSQANIEDTGKNNSMKTREWLPVWWKNQSAADKSILTLTILSTIMLLVRIRKAFQAEERIKIALLAAFAGILFWFILAPDPRFGFGFIIALTAIVSEINTSNRNKTYIDLRGKAFIAITLIATVAIGIYAVYRSINFFSSPQLLLPKGIRQVNYTTVKCNEITVNVPAKPFDCGCTPLPCAHDSCNTFEPRGEKITDGFRAK